MSDSPWRGYAAEIERLDTEIEELQSAKKDIYGAVRDTHGKIKAKALKQAIRYRSLSADKIEEGEAIEAETVLILNAISHVGTVDATRVARGAHEPEPPHDPDTGEITEDRTATSPPARTAPAGRAADESPAPNIVRLPPKPDDFPDIPEKLRRA